MNVQTFRTTCSVCDEFVESKVADFTGDNIILIDTVEGLDFNCNNCGNTTFIEFEKYTE